MTRIKMLSFTVEFVLSNEHLEVFMLCLGPKIFNEKVEVLFDFFLSYREKLQFSYQISLFPEIV